MSKIAIYARVSADDGDDVYSTSASNQVQFALKYLEEHNLTAIKIYVDDGYSGRDFNRPDFQRLLLDISLNEIDCIVIKDLSRLGRNYIEVGRLLEDYFLEKKVRVISINDNYDSFLNDDDTIAIRNYLNGLYLKECERKARQQVKRRCVSKNMTLLGQYGYMYDENKKIVIDPEAAVNVKRMFELYAGGLSYQKIAEIFTEEKIYTVAYYRYVRLGKSSALTSLVTKPDYNPYQWTISMVRKIIRDEEYTGVAVNRIYSRERKVMRRENPYIVDDTQEAIVTKELFDKCKARRVERTEATSKKEDIPRFVKKVYCGCCNHLMKFSLHFFSQKYKSSYYCSHCKSRVFTSVLYPAIYKDVEEVINNVSSSKFKEVFKKRQYGNQAKDSLLDLETKLKKNEAEYDLLFEKKINDEITDLDFHVGIEKLKKNNESLNKRKEELLAYNRKELMFDYNYEKFKQLVKSISLEKNKFLIMDSLIERINFKVLDKEKKLLEIDYKI